MGIRTSFYAIVAPTANVWQRSVSACRSLHQQTTGSPGIPDVVIVSTPPDEHARYVDLSLKHGKHFFSEADIWPFDYRRVEQVEIRSG